LEGLSVENVIKSLDFQDFKVKKYLVKNFGVVYLLGKPNSSNGQSPKVVLKEKHTNPDINRETRF
jgi:hypothetical protein